ncbi:hypothetical protein HispidOSU_021801, partial [Sigmodon hispidus]
VYRNILHLIHRYYNIWEIPKALCKFAHMTKRLCPLASTLGDGESGTSSVDIMRGSQALQNVYGHLSNKGDGVKSSLSALRKTDISLFAPRPSELSSLPNTTRSHSPCSQEGLGSFLSEGSLLPSPSSQCCLRPLESMIRGGGSVPSGEDTIKLSASAPGTKAHLPSFSSSSASKHYDQK